MNVYENQIIQIIKSSTKKGDALRSLAEVLEINLAEIKKKDSFNCGASANAVPKQFVYVLTSVRTRQRTPTTKRSVRFGASVPLRRSI